MYVITGVTGNTGSVVADTLLSQGQKVRVIVRDAAKGEAWRARGADVAVAALQDTDTVARALEGARGAYLLLPPHVTASAPIEHNRAVTASLRAAITKARVPHVVLLSSIAAQHPDGTGPIQTVHVAERELRETGARLTSVRAASFAENWAAALSALPTLPTFIPATHAYPQVSTVDIGRVAAAALVEGAKDHEIIELAGPRDLSPNDVAAAISTVTGQAIHVHEAPLDGVVPMLVGFGLSAPVAALIRELYAGITSRRVDWEGGSARRVRGSVTMEETMRKLLGK